MMSKPKPSGRLIRKLSRREQEVPNILFPNPTDLNLTDSDECCEDEFVPVSPSPKTESRVRERKQASYILQSRLVQSLAVAAAKALQEHSPVPVQPMNQSLQQVAERRSALDRGELSRAELVGNFLKSLSEG